MSENDALLKRADNPPFGIDTSERNLIADLAAALRRVEAERDSAVEQNTLVAQESVKTIARLAEYERFRGEAEKVAQVLCFGETYEPSEGWDKSSWTMDAQEVIAALTSAFASGAESKWQDIATAPKDGAVIQAFHVIWKSPKSVSWRETPFTPGCNWIETGYATAWPEDAFSHWQPLPAPPATGGEG